MRLFGLSTVVLVSALAGVAGADTIVLEGGQVLEADQAWYEGSVLRYRKDGQLWDLPREAISGVQPSNPEGTPYPQVRYMLWRSRITTMAQ